MARMKANIPFGVMAMQSTLVGEKGFPREDAKLEREETIVINIEAWQLLR